MSEAADDSRITVLVVDDDKAFCQALAGALRRRGFAVVVAHNYEDALSEAEAWSPDRAVVDLRMPGRSGLELVAALRRATRHRRSWCSPATAASPPRSRRSSSARPTT
jgi:ActR/RegA family two-component response regulator